MLSDDEIIECIAEAMWNKHLTGFIAFGGPNQASTWEDLPDSTAGVILGLAEVALTEARYRLAGGGTEA